MYHVKGSSMKNFKRIAALAGVVILLLIFCLPMAFAWGNSENAQALFRGLCGSSSGTDRSVCFLDGVPDLGK